MSQLRRVLIGVSVAGFVAFCVFAIAISTIVAAVTGCLPSAGAVRSGTVSLGSGPASEAYFAGMSEGLAEERKANAAIIIASGREKKLTDYSIAIGIGVAIQESGLRNLPYGDRDSLGLYQQRPSIISQETGLPYWGTPEQIMDPVYSSGRFFDELIKDVPERDSLPMVEVGIIVQNPDPNAYRGNWKWDAIALELVTGSSGAGCQSAGDWRAPLDRGITESDSFGWRIHPILGIRMHHDGADFSAPTGEPIYAVSAGVVQFAGLTSGYGNYVEISHENNIETGYAHMVDFADGITMGSKVKTGDIIGYVGSTGRSSGAHLHFEVKVNGEFQNPVDFMNGVGVDLLRPWTEQTGP